MKILITGANGYIGKSLYNIFKNKYNITTISRDDFDLTNIKATFDFFSNKYFDVVLHCAVKGGSRLQQDDWKIMDINLQMYYNLVSNKQHYDKLISFGSGAEIYFPGTPYGLSKQVIRKSIIEKDNFYNIRIFGVFDENELNTRFIKANIKRYINKEPIIVYQDKMMDFFYMKDLIKIVEYYINNENKFLPKEIECNYDEYITLKEIANLINNLDKHKVEIIIENKTLGEGYLSHRRNKLPINLIGLEQGIKEMYNKLK